MKKLITLFIAFTLCLSMAACGSTDTSTPPANTGASNEITDLLDEGLFLAMTSATEEYWRGILSSDDGSKNFMADAKITAAEYEELNAIEFDDEEGMRAFLGSLTDVTITDINDKLPSQDELDEYVGMTIGELEDMGFESTGWVGDEGDYQFFYDGPVYSCTVTPDASVVIEDLDDYSPNDIRAIVIGAVEYSGLSFSFLDNM